MATSLDIPMPADPRHGGPGAPPRGIRPAPGPGTRERSGTVASIPVSRARRVATCGCDVLLTGPTGTGKGRLARWLHDASGRAARPFVAVNAGALPEDLLDSHLFGHVRGAFSDAHRAHRGLVREADGGTLFLDEVGDLVPAAQVRLLRLLEEREVQPVGATGPEPVDVRVIAATGRDLEALVAEGAFREDLYYRLEVIGLRLEPLAARGGAEIDRLTDELLREIARELGRPPLTVSRCARALLRGHDWPGNVRELRSVLERIAVLWDDRDGRVVTADRVRGLGRIEPRGTRPAASPATSAPRRWRLEAARAAIAAAEGNVTAAAETLGVHRSTVHRWLAAS